ncbi:MAG: DUF4390 domain-containing protein [Sedimenticola sp.]|nr:DUF4390 domain-containing protein [Sedimenticola sp.]
MRTRVLAALMLLLLLPFPAAAEEFSITGLQAHREDDAYLMDATIEYRFSEQALEALENGVPLTLEVHIQLRREGAWLWESDLLDVRLRYQILFQALHGLYRVTDLMSGSQQHFATRQAALTALGSIRNVRLIQADRLTPGERYRLSLRSSLDIEALPLPLRPMAYLSPAWNLSSEWSLWHLEP